MRPNAVSEASTMKPLSGCDFLWGSVTIARSINYVSLLVELASCESAYKKERFIRLSLRRSAPRLRSRSEIGRHGFTIARFVAIVNHRIP